ncbi:hypothetical protein ACFSE0_11220 [Ochrobactrum teleogrylli]|uniref:Uncharacterized protein n=1 Tax=Ochrobactrum teleogrylli TaxID=2479765 RepID=A0ABY2XY68_9HYPH|nr:hypothetical protein [[Ochrobactrum] teleogrylli]TNV09323.1 hypothetical protein FIC94_22010 [[Ochrobactrum] teleogrylli]
MILTPFDKLTEIDTGNPYIGLTAISSGEKFLDIAGKFPRHQVFVKTRKSSFPTSIIKDGSIHVYYNAGGSVVGLELMVSELINDGQFLIWKEVNILQNTMQRINDAFEAFGVAVENTRYGLDIPNLGLSFYSSDFEDNLQSKVDSVYIELTRIG